MCIRDRVCGSIEDVRAFRHLVTKLCQTAKIRSFVYPVPTCTARLVKEIALLKSELRGIAVVRERCATLSNEVSSLKQALNALRKEPASSITMKSSVAGKQSKRSYAKAVSTLCPTTLPKSNATNSAPTPAVEAQQVQKAREPRTESARSTSGTKIKVDGARRIWNTMPRVGMGITGRRQ